jgi:hypothetical protein
MADKNTDKTIDDVMEVQTDDAMGELDPKTPEDMMGERSLGDDAAVNADEPKIVDLPPGSKFDDKLRP